MSSHYEGLSLSSIEGMSVGKPFIASDVDGLRDVVKGAGLLFPHEDANSLARIISTLLDDNILYEKVSEDCHTRSLDYSINKMLDGYEILYLTIYPSD